MFWGFQFGVLGVYLGDDGLRVGGSRVCCSGLHGCNTENPWKYFDSFGKSKI